MDCTGISGGNTQKHTCGHVFRQYVNSNMYGKMAAKISKESGRFLRAIALWQHACWTSPLETLQIARILNCLADILSITLSYNKKWHIKNNKEFLPFFNSSFPITEQKKLTIIPPNLRYRYVQNAWSSATSFKCRRVVNNYKARKNVWRHWCGYVWNFKIDPHL